MEWQVSLVLGTLAGVAFVTGIQDLVGVVRGAGANRRLVVGALVCVSVTVGTVALANLEVWPLFVVGFPSLASVVIEGGTRLGERVGQRMRRPGQRDACMAQLCGESGTIIAGHGRPGERLQLLRRV